MPSTEKILRLIAEHENSAFSDADIDAMSALPYAALQRLYLSLNGIVATNNQSVSELVQDDAPSIDNLNRELAELQAGLTEGIQQERQLLSQIHNCGGSASSVLAPIVKEMMTTNAAKQQIKLNDSIVQQYLNTGATPLTKIVAEGLTARKELRSIAIDSILRTAPEVYSQSDLTAMSTSHLQKLSSALHKRVSNPIGQTAPDWGGSGLADMTLPLQSVYNSATNPMDGVVSTDPLTIPSLWGDSSVG